MTATHVVAIGPPSLLATARGADPVRVGGAVRAGALGVARATSSLARAKVGGGAGPLADAAATGRGGGLVVLVVTDVERVADGVARLVTVWPEVGPIDVANLPIWLVEIHFWHAGPQ